MNVKKFVIFTVSLFCILLVVCSSYSFASSLSSINIDELDLSRIDENKINDLKDIIEEFKNAESNVDKEEAKEENVSISTGKVLNLYKELSKIVSNKDLVEFIEDNKIQLSNAGFSENLLDTSINLFNTFDADTLIDIAQNDLNADKLLTSYENGDSIDELVISIIDNTSPLKALMITFKLLFANSFFRLLFALLIVVSIYSIFITGIIFKKAGKKSFRYIYSNL